MKRWAFLTVLLYLVILVMVTVPAILLAFGTWGRPGRSGVSLLDVLQGYQEWGYWVWLAVMGLGQMLLLLVPLGIAERRLTPRRPLLIPVMTTSFFLANIIFGIILSVLCVIFKEQGLDTFAYVGALARAGGAAHGPVTTQVGNSQGGTGTSSLDYVVGAIAVIALLWLVWGVIFYRFSKADAPDALVKRTTRWLLRGSILELLVAVPSHIIVRNRNDCCAPMGTFWGITTGLSIMLLCFGPGVFFLFVERFNRLRPQGPGGRVQKDFAGDQENETAVR